MATCAYCGKTILFGGKRIGEYRFCNDTCLSNGRSLTVADQIPNEVVMELASKIHRGSCPKCQGPGPVDVHNAYTVWSALVMTSWKTQRHVACDDCGRKAQVRAILSALVLGWWGFPWGFLVTPIQLAKNIGALRRGTDPLRPSEDLIRLARLHLASQRPA